MHLLVVAPPTTGETSPPIETFGAAPHAAIKCAGTGDQVRRNG
jgi:hypothetical protein